MIFRGGGESDKNVAFLAFLRVLRSSKQAKPSRPVHLKLAKFGV